MRAAILCIVIGLASPSAMAAAPDGKGILCTDQAIAEDSGDIDAVIHNRTLAFQFADGTVLSTRWRRNNDDVITKTAIAGSRYRTNNLHIGWVSRRLIDGETIAVEFTLNRQTLALTRQLKTSISNFACELIDQPRIYEEMLAKQRQDLQGRYDARLAANKL